MKLSTFFAALFALAATAIGALFWYQSAYLVGRGFEQSNQVHLESVREYSATSLRAKKHLLETITSDPPRHTALAKALLLQESPAERAALYKVLKMFQKSAGADFVDVVVGRRTQTVKYAIPISSAMHSKHGFILLEKEGAPQLVFVFPVRLLQDRVGLGLIGFALNGPIAQAIEQATGTQVESATSGDPALGTGKTLTVNSAGVQITWRVQQSTLERVGSTTTSSLIYSGALCIVLVWGLLWWLLQRGLLSGVRALQSDMSATLQALESGTLPLFPARPHPLREVRDLSAQFATLAEAFDASQKRLQLKTRTEAMGEKAAQVAHDFKGPLAALRMALEHYAPQLPRIGTDSILTLVNRLDAMVADVATSASAAPSNRPCSLPPLLHALVQEKKLRFSHLEVSIRLDFPAQPNTLSVEADTLQLRRVLSNLIDNAIEAAAKPPHEVTIQIRALRSKVWIRIGDNGKGLPKSKSKRLGERGFTWGKPGGSGLGVWYSMQCARSWGTRLSYSPQRNGQGTRVCFALPWAQKDETPQVDLAGVETLVVLDDAADVHLRIQSKLASIANAPELLSFRTPEAFIEWTVRNRHKPGTRYWIDQHLVPSPWTGIELIEELGLQAQASLFTESRSEGLRARCKDSAIHYLHKSSTLRCEWLRPSKKRSKPA